MPARVIDFDAMWSSDKLASCPESATTDYAWVYGVADGNGSFEINLRAIWGKVSASRKELTLERLTQSFHEFEQRGLLFTWTERGKRYGHWANCEKQGRLPRPSRRGGRYGRLLAPLVPDASYREYLARFEGATPNVSHCDGLGVEGLGLGLGFGLGLGKGRGKDMSETNVVSDAPRRPARARLQVSDEARTLAALLRDLVLENNPTNRDARKADTLERWGADADLMMRRDKRTAEQIKALIEWSQRDSFWHRNVLSMGKLRKQFDRLVPDYKKARNGNANGKKGGHELTTENERARQASFVQ